jgi:ubiquinone/menaquinone biosynthesis C-methylase UbiE
VINYLSYSEMLSIQVDMCFPFEKVFFDNIGLGDMQSVVEIGCGNGYFLNMISKQYPMVKYFGYDISDELIKIAVEGERSNVNFQVGTIDHLTTEHDLLILRLIMHQIENRKKFIETFSKILSDKCKVVIIDPFDELFQLKPELPGFNQHLVNHRNILSPNLASRDTKNFIEQEMAEFGFKLDKQIYYYVPSSLPSYKKSYYNYMIATSKIIGCSQHVLDEIDTWYWDSNSHAQIGLFMYNFKK